jgi:hypothetical protein
MPEYGKTIYKANDTRGRISQEYPTIDSVNPFSNNMIRKLFLVFTLGWQTYFRN